MKLRKFISALLTVRNLTVLLICAAGTYLFNLMMYGGDFSEYYLLPGAYSVTVGAVETAAVVVLYLVFVSQTLLSKGFKERFQEKERIRQVQDLNYACIRQARETRKHVSPTYLQKLRKVMADKNEVVDAYFRGEQSYIKEKIVTQALNLVLAYNKLLMNFCIRSHELSEVNQSDINDKINVNTRKLNFTKDVHMAEDLKGLIEMDQKMLQRLKEEKKELERISAKLDYMERTVSMFKHQIISNIESEDMLGKMETVVNEALALDRVLEDRRRNRMRY